MTYILDTYKIIYYVLHCSMTKKLTQKMLDTFQEILPLKSCSLPLFWKRVKVFIELFFYERKMTLILFCI
jgi:hypothetical protein